MNVAAAWSEQLEAVVSGNAALETPAFIYDESGIVRLLRRVTEIRERTGCRPLFAVKSFCFRDALELMAPYLDGFAVSSLFEAKLARSVLGDRGTVHFTTPGLRPRDAAELGRLCDYVAFNSVGQWRAYRDALRPSVRCGLRVNPELSFIGDARYDPCRPGSRLGEPLATVAEVLDEPDSVSGLLLHTNCDATDFGQLEATVNKVRHSLGHRLEDGRLQWVNLGGGYLFEDESTGDVPDLMPLYRTVDLLQHNCDLETIMEPGAALIRAGCYLVATVLDVQTRDGHRTAILDTTVNHMPEVFEYQYEPDVLGHRDEADWAYTLAGCTCLAGDVFGEYCFDAPLLVGDRVVFLNMGAYTLVKAHMFNGVNLPTIYALDADGNLIAKRRFTYDDFASRWGESATSWRLPNCTNGS